MNEDFFHDSVSGTTTLNGSTPVAPNHLFQVGSETKSFIAAIILQLEAERKLSIEDPIGNYISDISEAWKNITIKQLLNHTSGIPNYTDVLEELYYADKNFDFKKQWATYELINLVTNKPLNFEPGTGWFYSNTNYVLLGLIIEIVSRHPVDDEIKARILSQLHLANTHYLPSLYTDQIMRKMAHGYSERNFFPDEPKDITDTNSSWANTAGAIVSTSHDMAIWLKNLLFNDALLPEQQREELMTLVDGVLPKNGAPIGYGLGIVHDYATFREESWWHSGGTLGFSALMVWLKCHNIIITTNINHISADRDIYNLVQELAAFLQKTEDSNYCLPEKSLLSQQSYPGKLLD